MQEIVEHPFFADIDFEKLHKRELEAPFIPDLSDDMDDTSNFEPQDSEVLNSVVPTSDLEMIKKRQQDFVDFDN